MIKLYKTHVLNAQDQILASTETCTSNKQAYYFGKELLERTEGGVRLICSKKEITPLVVIHMMNHAEWQNKMIQELIDERNARLGYRLKQKFAGIRKFIKHILRPEPQLPF